jgi:hypothetical protein
MNPMNKSIWAAPYEITRIQIKNNVLIGRDCLKVNPFNLVLCSYLRILKVKKRPSILGLFLGLNVNMKIDVTIHKRMKGAKAM